MREIKFRAWHKYRHWMVPLDGIAYDEDEDEQKAQHPRNHVGGIIGGSISSYELMQYTGLKDQNGVEIYEGDICWDALDEYHGKVIFDEGSYRYIWSNINESLFECAFGLEVIGNIYENPELLEAAKAPPTTK